MAWLLHGQERGVGEFRTTFRTIPAFATQSIDLRLPKLQVAGSIPAGSATQLTAMLFP
jgi:hypothetical protein